MLLLQVWEKTIISQKGASPACCLLSNSFWPHFFYYLLSQGVKSPSDLRLELVVLNWLLEFRMTTWSDSTATSHANTCTPTHDFFHFEACIQLRSFQKLWDDSQRAFQYQFRSWLLFFNIIYWRYNNIIVQARKSEKSLSKRLVPFSESEKSLQVLNTAQTKQFGQKNSTLHAHEVRKKTTIDWLLWNNFIGTVERIILLHHVCKPSWVCVDVDPKEVYFFQDLIIYCTKTTDWKGYTK